MNNELVEQRLVQPDVPISRKQAAKLLGVCLDTLDSWTVRLSIPHIKYDLPDNPGNKGKVIYFAKDLVAFRERFRVTKQVDVDASGGQETKVACGKS